MKKLLSLLAISASATSLSANAIACRAGGHTAGKVDFPGSFEIEDIYQGESLYQYVNNAISKQVVDAQGSQIFMEPKDVANDPDIVILIYETGSKDFLPSGTEAELGMDYEARITIDANDQKLNPMPEKSFAFSTQPPSKKVPLPNYDDIFTTPSDVPTHKDVYNKVRKEIVVDSKGKYKDIDALRADETIVISIWNGDHQPYSETDAKTKLHEILHVTVSADSHNAFYNKGDRYFMFAISH